MSEFEWEYIDNDIVDLTEEENTEYYYDDKNDESSSWESYYDDIAEEIEY